MKQAQTFFTGASVVVTGSAGSVGRQVVRRLLELPVAHLRVLDNNETGLFDLEQEFAGEPRISFFCADICDEGEMNRAFAGMDYGFHLAALKHVPSCERNPTGALKVNIEGCQTVIRAALTAGLKKVLFTSSDKAVSPPNVMGASKLFGERLFTAANEFSPAGGRSGVFASTRFGNVAGSRGSVVPLFLKQIAAGGPVTVTDPGMTRFVMRLDEAADLVVESIVHALPGDVFITKMPALRILDLAEVMIEVFAPLFGHAPADIAIRITGSRPGEKFWEELNTEEESRRLLEGGRYLCVLPPDRNKPAAHHDYAGLRLRRSAALYNSACAELMPQSAIQDFLLQPGVLGTDSWRCWRTILPQYWGADRNR